MITLKNSFKDYTKEFEDKFDLQSFLYNQICEQCRCENGISQISNISDMLSVACGLEFKVYYG